MKPITGVLLSGLMLAGCAHRHVTVVESSPASEGDIYEDEVYPADEVVLEEACEPAWDGHAFVVIESHQHGFGCGHFFHHGCWHLHPFDWIYLEIGYSHCGETGGFYYAGDPWARVWDGCAFVMLRGHVHGAGCGHHYHHGCWNACPSDYVYADHRRSHFSKSPPARHSEMAVRSRRPEERASRRSSGMRVEAESASRRAEPARAAAPRREIRNVEAPGRGQQAERKIEPAAHRAQPQRIEQPKRQEAPRRQEAPQRIEQPKKQEAPKRIEPPQRREPPKKEQPPQRREAPKEREKEKRR